jgi:uncharacterized protein YpuA (DUF1002 family)
MNKLEELEDNMIKSMEITFEQCYSCTRTWSAWSYNTMTQNDFVPFDKDDEAFSECFTDIKNSIIKQPFKTEEEFYDRVIDKVSNYTLYFNENMDRRFCSEAFNADVCDIVDLKDMYEKFKNFQDVLKEEIKPTKKNKIKP